MADEKKSFWETLPGIFTGLAALVTAFGGVLALFVKNVNTTAAPSTKPVAAPTATHRKQKDFDNSSEQVNQQTFNLSGVWRDVVFGNQVRIEQHGDRIRTMTYNPVNWQQLAAGEAVVEGSSVIGSNRWANGATYSVNLKISRDGDAMTGTYRSTFNGESGNVHLTRN